MTLNPPTAELSLLGVFISRMHYQEKGNRILDDPHVYGEQENDNEIQSLNSGSLWGVKGGTQARHEKSK